MSSGVAASSDEPLMEGESRNRAESDATCRPDPAVGCLRTCLIIVAIVAIVTTGVLVYLSVGVSQAATRAQKRLDLIDDTLNRLPLQSIAVNNEFRNPVDRNEAETAIRAQRLGQYISYFFYCGDQCPGWGPGDPVEIQRDESLAPNAWLGNSCDQVGRLLRSVAGLYPVAPGIHVAASPGCSFAGCIGVVGVRVELLGVDGKLKDVYLSGIVGTPQLGMLNPPPACPHR